jgi:hypothetical protein
VEAGLKRICALTLRPLIVSCTLCEEVGLWTLSNRVHRDSNLSTQRNHMVSLDNFADRESINRAVEEIRVELRRFSDRVVLHVVLAVTAIVTAALLILVCAFRLAG